MATNQQLNPNERAFKYRFDLQLIKFKYPFSFPCTIEVVWYRGKSNIKTKHPIQVKGKQKEISINQIMSSMSTCSFNNQTKQFKPKQYEIIVVMNINGSPKRLGMLYIDLCSILDPYDPLAPKSKLFDNGVLLKAPNDSRLVFKLSAVFQQSVVPSDKSIGSQIGNGPLNTSGFSITQQPKFMEKRLYQIPSKDSYSVTSYNANTYTANTYNTGIRYPNSSAKRQNRQDSSSVKKQEYGLKRQYNPTSYGGIMRSTGSNEYELKTQTLKNIIDNRTENNDGGYLSKQLTEQQNKRSKLQSQLNKNNLYIDELKKKLTEYLALNTKMKEQLNNTQKQSDKQTEIFQLNNKIYDQSNEIRDLKNNIEYKTRIIDNLQKQKHILVSQKAHQNYLIENLKKKSDEQKQNENFMRVNEYLETQNKELKAQREKFNIILKDYQKKLEEKDSSTNEKYRQINELNAKIEYFKKQLDKARSNQFASNSLESTIKDMSEELNKRNKEIAFKSQSIYQLQRQISDLRKASAQFEAQKCYLQREISNQKQQILIKKQNDKQKQQHEFRIQHLSHQNKTLSDRVIALSRQLDQKSRNINKLQQQRAVNEVKYNKSNDLIRDRQNQIIYHKDKCSKLENIKQEYESVINKLKEQVKTASTKNLSASTTSENDTLLRESLKMQVQLKFAHDQLNRLKGIEELYENQKWKAETQTKNKQQIEKQFERVEKQLIGKNRAMMIEVQKSKMLTQQLNEANYNMHLINQELDRSRNIIFNGQKQVSLMNADIEHLKYENEQMRKDLELLSQERSALINSGEEIRVLQGRVQELEERNAEKMVSLEKMNSDLALKNNEIQSLQKIGEEKQRQLTHRDKILTDLQSKCKFFQSAKSQIQSELTKAMSQKKSLQKRTQMAMEEMHMMKKRFQEQKGRSISYARTEEYGKLRGLQNQIQKKDKLISKLSKQKLELEQQNVKINVQVMKLLSEMEKGKTSNSTINSAVTSSKTIISLKH